MKSFLLLQKSCCKKAKRAVEKKGTAHKVQSKNLVKFEKM
jgi:hypothetical protein